MFILPGMYMEGNKRVKHFPLENNSGFGRKKQRKKQRKNKNPGSQFGQNFK
jgi:hypothetical protein